MLLTQRLLDRARSLDADADVDHARSREGATALYIASQKGHSLCVEAMLEADVTIDLPMHDGSTCVAPEAARCRRARTAPTPHRRRRVAA
jgi:ankyrin repeat protein